MSVTEKTRGLAPPSACWLMCESICPLQLNDKKAKYAESLQLMQKLWICSQMFPLVINCVLALWWSYLWHDLEHLQALCACFHEPSFLSLFRISAGCFWENHPGDCQKANCDFHNMKGHISFLPHSAVSTWAEVWSLSSSSVAPPYAVSSLFLCWYPV